MRIMPRQGLFYRLGSLRDQFFPLAPIIRPDFQDISFTLNCNIEGEMISKIWRPHQYLHFSHVTWYKMYYFARRNTKVHAWRRSTLKKVKQGCFRTAHLPVYRNWIWCCYRHIALFVFPCIKHVMNQDRRHNNVSKHRARTKEQKNSNMEWIEKPLRVNVLKVLYVIDERCRKKSLTTFLREETCRFLGLSMPGCLFAHASRWNRHKSCKKKTKL